MPRDHHLAPQHVIEAGDELNESALALARAADDADGFAGAYMEADIGQRQVLGIVGIAEIDVFELDIAVFDLEFRIGAYNIELLVQHLVDAGDGRLDHRDADDYERDHGERAYYLRRVGHEAGQLARAEGLEPDYLHAAEGEEYHRTGPHDEELYRPGEGEYFLSLYLGSFKIVDRLVELLLLVLLAHEGLYDAHRDKVLLHGGVHAVGLFEHLHEEGMPQLDEYQHRGDEEGDRDREYPREARVDAESHYRRENHHHWRADEYPYDLLERVLHHSNVSRRADDEGRCGEFVGVCEGKRLYLVENGAAEVFSIAHRGDRRRPRAEHSAGEGKERRDDHQRAEREDELHAPCLERSGYHGAQEEILPPVKPSVDYRRHQERYQHLECDLENHEERGEQRRKPVSFDKNRIPPYPVRLGNRINVHLMPP